MENLPLWLISILGLLVLSGVLVIAMGSRLPRQGDWLVLTALSAVVIAIILHWSGYLGDGPLESELVGWVFRQGDDRSLRFGMAADHLGLLFVFLSALLGGAALFPLLRITTKSHAPQFVLGSIALSTVGSAVCWTATTPWLYSFGVTFLIVGGAFAFRRLPEKKNDGKDVERFLRERLLGFLFLLLGVGAWSSLGIDLRPDTGASWAGSLSTVALILLLFGVLFQFQAIPLLKSHLLAGETSGTLRLLATQIFPGWASFALLLRFQKDFEVLGVLGIASWISLGLALLTAFAGLLQREARNGVPMLQAVVFLIAFSALIQIGPGAAIAILLSATFGVLGISYVGELNPEEEERQRSPASAYSLANRIPVFSAGLAVTGGLGLLSSAGFSLWVNALFGDPWALAGGLFVLSVFSAQAWRVVWLVLRSQPPRPHHWTTLLFPYVLSIGTIGVIWQGFPVVALLEDANARLFQSIIEGPLGFKISGLDNDQGFSITAILQGVLVSSFLFASWLSAPTVDRLTGLWDRFPVTTRFIGEGYGLDKLAERLLTSVLRLGVTLSKVFDLKIWESWIPRLGEAAIANVSGPAGRADQRLRAWIDRSSARTVAFPGKLVQLLQSGDVQWYLFFAIGSALALLLHFMQSSPQGR